jgi:hypothetical protein
MQTLNGIWNNVFENTKKYMSKYHKKKVKWVKKQVIQGKPAEDPNYKALKHEFES